MRESIFEKAKRAKENKKGFTLVELIVVLVILAILAAILVPALLGWIDKAKEKQVVLEGRVVLMAAQTVASEEYAKKAPTYSAAEAAAAIDAYIKDDAPGNYSVTIESNKVTEVIYTSSGSSKTTVTWSSTTGQWTQGGAEQSGHNVSGNILKATS